MNMSVMPKAASEMDRVVGYLNQGNSGTKKSYNAPNPVERKASQSKSDIGLYGVGDSFLDVVGKMKYEDLTTFGLSTKYGTNIEKEFARKIHDKMRDPQIFPGGNIPNALFAAACMGVPTALMADVGDDPWGQIVIDKTKEAGIEAKINKVPNEKTSIVQVAVLPDGERAMAILHGKGHDVPVPSIEDLKKSKFMISKANFLRYVKNQTTIPEGLRKAKEAGCTTVLHMQDPEMVKDVRKKITKIVNDGLVDIMIGSQSEFEKYFDIKDYHKKHYFDTDEMAERVIHKAKESGKHIVFTRGNKGAVIVNNGKVHHIDPIKTENVTDTTGAGDSFAGGYIAGLAIGKNETDAGKIAAHIASETIQHRGARAPIDVLKSLRSRLSGQGLI
ncbi:MAG: PfkB family carbohydrate kinase [Pseudomonadota bacterium]